jgi:hypothetical protein
MVYSLNYNLYKRLETFFIEKESTFALRQKQALRLADHFVGA